MLWLDTYFQWLSPATKCCGIVNNTAHKNYIGDYCKNPGQGNCTKCPISNYENNRPTPEDFNKYIHYWLKSNPDVDCPAGGHAAFGSGVKFVGENVKSECHFKSILGQ